MTAVQVELLTDQRNAAVLRLPERRFPGVLLQGDTLNYLATRANEAARAQARGDMETVGDELREIQRILNDARARYEAALAEHGLALPY